MLLNCFQIIVKVILIENDLNDEIDHDKHTDQLFDQDIK